HAASVRPEPGSNSHKKNLLAHNKADFKIIIDVSFRSVFKDQTLSCSPEQLFYYIAFPLDCQQLF
ncbi:hypothetical protein, partial [Siminovitchia terrae]|uniref:hypothetical protein n=1 Tax=Siminovitchia terrae TaxID=1914933 RepID=UPI001BB32FE5